MKKNLIAITTDRNGNLIGNTSFPLMKIVLNDLDMNCGEKRLLANLLDKNYVVYKTPVQVLDKMFFQYLFEEWRINNNLNLRQCKHSPKKQLKDINLFSMFEQEIIYCLLSGYTIDKVIEQFLVQATRTKPKGNIKYAVAALFTKFECDNRTTLIDLLKYYELDRYLPITIFPPGVYQI